MSPSPTPPFVTARTIYSRPDSTLNKNQPHIERWTICTHETCGTTVTYDPSKQTCRIEYAPPHRKVPLSFHAFPLHDLAQFVAAHTMPKEATLAGTNGPYAIGAVTNPDVSEQTITALGTSSLQLVQGIAFDRKNPQKLFQQIDSQISLTPERNSPYNQWEYARTWFSGFHGSERTLLTLAEQYPAYDQDQFVETATSNPVRLAILQARWTVPTEMILDWIEEGDKVFRQNIKDIPHVPSRLRAIAVATL